VEAVGAQVGQLQADLAAAGRQREEAVRQLAEERALAAAQRAEEARHSASSHELQEAWKSMANEFQLQLKVRELACWMVVCYACWRGVSIVQAASGIVHFIQQWLKTCACMV
jgi:hypothetical protein